MCRHAAAAAGQLGGRPAHPADGDYHPLVSGERVLSVGEPAPAGVPPAWMLLPGNRMLCRMRLNLRPPTSTKYNYWSQPISLLSTRDLRGAGRAKNLTLILKCACVFNWCAAELAEG